MTDQILMYPFRYFVFAFSFVLCHALHGQIIGSMAFFETDPADQSFSDLRPLKELWKDKRIVMLGEQSHGEGAVFKEKVRLIKFLHQEMGFEIIAFESGLYDNYRAYNNLDPNDSINQLTQSVLPIWSDTKEVRELLNYVKRNKNKRPLQVTGFDFFTSEYKWQYWDELKAVITDNEVKWPVIEEVFFGNAELLIKDINDSIKFFYESKKILKWLNELKSGSEHISILHQAFAGWLFEIRWEIDALNGERIYVQNPRDEWMAKNLIFLSQLYPGKKIIAWGASYHFANDMSSYENTDLTRSFIHTMHERSQEDHAHTTEEELFDLDQSLEGAITMGQIAKSYFGDSLYSLAFSSFKGKFGIATSRYLQEMVTPPKGSIEFELVEKGLKNVVVDYRQLGEKFYSSVLGNLPVYANWQYIFDGLYFLHDAYPPQAIEYLDQYEELSKLTVSSDENLYGQVFDKTTKEGVPFASIALVGTSKGTSGNGQGKFVFNSATQGQLVFSSIGYANDTLNLNELKNKDDIKVFLQPKDHMLPELVIMDKPLEVEDIIKKARKEISQNYCSKSFNQEVFYRTISYKEDSVLFKEEGSVMLYLENGFLPKSKVFGNVLQYRNSKLAKHKWQGIGSLWLMLGHDVIMDKDNVLFRTAAYDLTLVGVLEFNGRFVYDVKFDCKRPNAFTTGFGYPAPVLARGSIYIATDDYAILKYEVCIARKPHTFKKESHKQLNPFHHHLSQTYKQQRNKYFLNTSYSQSISRTVDSKLGISKLASEERYLFGVEIFNDKVTPIKRPLVKLTQGSKVKEDPSFWRTHNYILDQMEHNFYCSDWNSFD